MSNKTNNYFQKNKKLFSDFLELGIVIAFLFMIVCIYVPRAIWDEEEFYHNKSHFNMENLFDAQNFYKSIKSNLSYPIIKNIPILRVEKGIIFKTF